VAPRVLLELGRRRQLLATRLAGEHLGPGQLLAVLLRVRRQLALEDELISALATDKVLREDRRTDGWMVDWVRQDQQMAIDHGNCG